MRSRDFITCAPGGALTDQDDAVGAGVLEPRQLRHHVDVVVLEFLDAGDLDRRIGLARGLQSLFVALAPGIVDEHQAGFLGAEFLMRKFEELDVDQRIDRRNAEGIVRIGAIARDAGARRPHAHIDALFLVEHRHHRQRHRRIDAAEDRRDVFGDKFARGDQSLGRARFIVALHQFEHAPAKETALGVDLVDRQLSPRVIASPDCADAARQSRHLPDLDRIGGEGRRDPNKANAAPATIARAAR